MSSCPWLPDCDDPEEPPREGGQSNKRGQVLPKEDGTHLARVVLVQHGDGLQGYRGYVSFRVTIGKIHMPYKPQVLQFFMYY